MFQRGLDVNIQHIFGLDADMLLIYIAVHIKETDPAVVTLMLKAGYNLRNILDWDKKYQQLLAPRFVYPYYPAAHASLLSVLCFAHQKARQKDGKRPFSLISRAALSGVASYL